jgi:hypothetical protein
VLTAHTGYSVCSAVLWQGIVGLASAAMLSASQNGPCQLIHLGRPCQASMPHWVWHHLMHVSVCTISAMCLMKYAVRMGVLSSAAAGRRLPALAEPLWAMVWSMLGP